MRYSKILDETIKNIVPSSRERMVEKEKELNSLLKTPKGLGKLEELAIQLEGIKKDYRPEKKIIVVMAANNGVEREKVSKIKENHYPICGRSHAAGEILHKCPWKNIWSRY